MSSNYREIPMPKETMEEKFPDFLEQYSKEMKLITIEYPSMHGPWYNSTYQKVYVSKDFDTKAHQESLLKFYGVGIKSCTK